MLMIVIIILQWQKSANLASRCHGTPKISQQTKTNEKVCVVRDGGLVSKKTTLHIDIDVILMLLEVVYSLVVASSSFTHQHLIMHEEGKKRDEQKIFCRKSESELSLSMNSACLFCLLRHIFSNLSRLPARPRHIQEIYSCPKIYSHLVSAYQAASSDRRIWIYIFFVVALSALQCWRYSSKYSQRKMSQMLLKNTLQSVSQFFNRHRMLRGMVAYSVLWPGEFLMTAFLTCLKTFLWLASCVLKLFSIFSQLARWFNKLWRRENIFLITTGTKFWGEDEQVLLLRSLLAAAGRLQFLILHWVNAIKLFTTGGRAMEKYEFSIFHSFFFFSLFFCWISWKVFPLFLRFQRTNTIYVNFMENVCLGLYPNSPPPSMPWPLSLFVIIK